MILAKVVGTVVASQKEPKIEGAKLLLLEKIDPVTMKGKNDFVVSIDAVGAGIGEIVFYASGSGARQTVLTQGVPTDATVVAIVDAIEKDGDFTFQKQKKNDIRKS